MTTGRDATDPTDEQWVSALKCREEWAWERLHQQTLERVFAYVHRHCPRREDAEDITAEVYAAAVVSIDRFRGEASVVTWLIAIARRRLVDHARRRGRRHELLEADLPVATNDVAAVGDWSEDSTTSPEALVVRRETDGRVRRMVLGLPKAQREALLLRCVDELSLAETARVLGRTQNAVKGLIHRARVTLLERMTAAQLIQPTNARQEPQDAEPLPSTILPAAPPCSHE